MRTNADGHIICDKLLLRPDVSRAYWKDADLGLTFGAYNIVYLLASNVRRSYRVIYDQMGSALDGGKEKAPRGGRG